MRNFEPPRSRRLPPAHAVLALCLVIAIFGAVACSNGKDDPEETGTGAVPAASDETPEFDFVIDRITPYTAAPGRLPKGIPPEVQRASEQIAAEATLLYKAAFLDPANWREGNYDSFFAGFEQKAGGAAKGQVDELTAGTAAGDMYTEIQPGFAHLNTKVMLDERGHPLWGVAIVDFNATATGTDGADVNLHSDGQYFMRPRGNGWEVFAYDVNRQDGGKIPEAAPADKKDKKDKENDPAPAEGEDAAA